MKKIWLLPEKGNFYKANLHCHTTCSDGRLTPEECKQLYQEEGYSVLAVTDHRMYQWHEELTDERFLLLAACEMDINDVQVSEDFSRVKTYHLNLYDTCPQRSSGEKKYAVHPHLAYEDKHGINRYIEKMRKLGFLVCYNHPYWSLQTCEDYGKLEGLFALEVYNHSCELDGMYGFQPQVYDELLRRGKMIRCLASDDNHNLCEQDDPMWDSFGGFTMIKTECLTYERVISALQNGDFYCSMGPQITKLYLKDSWLYVSCSPAKRIYMMTEGRKCRRVLAGKSGRLTEAEFQIRGDEGYIRVDVEDEYGRHALSNAYFLPLQF